MGNENNSSSPRTDPAGEPPAPIYVIRVKGCMDEVFWADWFGGMEISIDLDQAETTLRGPISDQAELYGLLSRLRNKGLTLISVQSDTPG
jgi:hypothetical protein